MKELVIISGKGGTGKTSVTGALAYLAENAVFADCDVDAADLHLVLKPQIISEEPFWGMPKPVIDSDLCTQCGRCRELCRFDAITTDFRIDPVNCEGCAVCVWNCPEKAISLHDHQSGVLFISATARGPMVHARLDAGEENSGKLVSKVRTKAKEIAETGKSGMILVDGPPGTGCPVIASLGGADLLLIVTEPSLSAVHDMKRTVALARHFNVPAALCINKCDINADITKEITEYGKKNNIEILAEIPYNANILLAQKLGKSVFMLNDVGLNTRFRQLWQKIQTILNI
ncbi:MAG TPA: ATP-binding protein [bacterium]|nr:ATP-binding protein [bacterium]HPN45378.1 ATP-binding protein [bacterium]